MAWRICKEGSPDIEMKKGCLYFIDLDGKLTEAIPAEEIDGYAVDRGQIYFRRKEVKNEIH